MSVITPWISLSEDSNMYLWHELMQSIVDPSNLEDDSQFLTHLNLLENEEMESDSQTKPHL